MEGVGEGNEGSGGASPRGQVSVIDPIRMESDAEIRGFLINRQPAPFSGRFDDFVSSRPGPKNLRHPSLSSTLGNHERQIPARVSSV